MFIQLFMLCHSIEYTESIIYLRLLANVLASLVPRVRSAQRSTQHEAESVLQQI